MKTNSRKNCYEEFITYSTFSTINFDTTDDRVASFGKAIPQGDSFDPKFLFHPRIYKGQEAHNLGVVIAADDSAGEAFKKTVATVECMMDSFDIGLVVLPNMAGLSAIVQLEAEDKEAYQNASEIKEAINEFRQDSQNGYLNSIAFTCKFNVEKNNQDHGSAPFLQTEAAAKTLIFLVTANPEPLLSKLYWVFYVVCGYLQPKHIYFFTSGLKFLPKSIKKMDKLLTKQHIGGCYGVVKLKFAWSSAFASLSYFEQAFDYQYLKQLESSAGLCSTTPYDFVAYKWTAVKSDVLNRFFMPLVTPEVMGWADTVAYLKSPFSVLNEELTDRPYDIKKPDWKYDIFIADKAVAYAKPSPDFASNIAQRADNLHSYWIWMLRRFQRRSFLNNSLSRSLVQSLGLLIIFSISLMMGIVFTTSIIAIKVSSTQTWLELILPGHTHTRDLVLVGYKTFYVLMLVITAIWSLSLSVKHNESRYTWKLIKGVNLVNTAVVLAGWVVNLAINELFSPRIFVGIVTAVIVLSISLREQGWNMLWTLLKAAGYLVLMMTYTNTIWLYAALNQFQCSFNNAPFYFGKPQFGSLTKAQMKLISKFSLKRAMMVMGLISVNLVFTAVYEVDQNRSAPLFVVYIILGSALLSPLLACMLVQCRQCLCIDSREDDYKKVEVSAVAR
jgi:hypothetical protein